jgi:hypothetical protein
MIDKKYIRLMNLALDKAISPEENRDLEEFLARNPEARAYAKELGAAWAVLCHTREVVVMPDLKKEVLESLRSGEFRPETSRRKETVSISTPSYHHLRLRYVFFFACGLVLGVMLFFLFKSQGGTSSFDSQSLLGTLVSSKSLNVAERITIEEKSVRGEVVLKTTNDMALAEIRLETSQEVELALSFDPGTLTVNTFQREEGDAGRVQIEADRLTIISSGNHEVWVGFKTKSTEPSPLKFQIRSSGTILYEKEIQVPAGRKG